MIPMDAFRLSLRAARSICFALVALITISPQTLWADSPDGPNVLFLICDDLNCDLGCYGHKQVRTPNIDNLAKRGFRFERAYCQYPLCGPSRASFMTSLYPEQTLVTSNPDFLRGHLPKVTTLPQMFRKQGYFATRIGKIFHYGVPGEIGTGGYDDPKSWDYTINPRGRDKDEEDLIFSLRPGEYGGIVSWLAAEGADAEQTDGIAAREAVKMMRRHVERDEKFFLAVGLYRPHTPYVAPKSYFSAYPPKQMEIPQIPEDYLDTIPAGARKKILKKRVHHEMSHEHARQAKQAYYASVSFADAQIGLILNALKELGIEDDTIVLFTSDHGYHLGEHGHWLKTTLYENAARVPLIMAGPGIPASGESTPALAEMIDIYPTLAQLCGLNPPAYLEGVSLTETFADRNAQPRTSALTMLTEAYSIRTPDFRYSEWGENAEMGAELYDHRVDPQEMRNLIDDPNYKLKAVELKKLLQQRSQAARRPPEGLKQVRSLK